MSPVMDIDVHSLENQKMDILQVRYRVLMQKDEESLVRDGTA